MNARCTVLVVRIIVEVTWGMWHRSCMSPEVFYVQNFPTFSTVQHPACTGIFVDPVYVDWGCNSLFSCELC